ncbi:MAG: aspartate aminotransferase family protein [Meiothermus sp.]|nr:aspartate aminotransferase family protein [Meiothermus sp.]
MTQDQTQALLEEAQAVMVRYAPSFLPVVAVRAEGSFVYTADGRRLLDFTSGQMCSVLGHNHPEIVEAVVKASHEVMHLLSTMLSPPVVELCARLAELTPPGLDKTLLLNTGSESVEAAIRMAKLTTGGFEVWGFTGSWHGLTAGANASTYAAARRGYGPTLPGTTALPAPNSYRCPVRHCQNRCDLTCLEVGVEMADKQAVGAPAAIVVEPLLSTAGIIDLPEGYLARLKQVAQERGMRLILDEAQTALGRVGTLFAFERDGITPDFLALSKTLGGGLPLAATMTSAEVEEACYAKGFVYVTSHVSDPLPAEVGLAVLRVVEREHLAQRAREMGAYLRNRLEELQTRQECIGDVRGRGLLLGMEIVADRERKTPAPELGYAITQRCLELGLSMNIVRMPWAGGVFRIAPPLTISREEIDLGVEILERAIAECWAARG